MSDPTLLVLASLADGDKHGYAMMVDIRGFAGVDLGPGTLYGAITRLEGKWKTSQNRPEADRVGVAEGLAAEGDTAMADLVARR